MSTTNSPTYPADLAASGFEGEAWIFDFNIYDESESIVAEGHSVAWTDKDEFDKVASDPGALLDQLIDSAFSNLRPGVSVQDGWTAELYQTPIEVEGHDGWTRSDFTEPDEYEFDGNGWVAISEKW